MGDLLGSPRVAPLFFGSCGVPFQLATCRPNGFGPPYRRRAIVDSVTHCKIRAVEIARLGIFPVFCRVEDPIVKVRSAETVGFLDGRGESYGWKRLVEGMGPVRDRCGHVS